MLCGASLWYCHADGLLSALLSGQEILTTNRLSPSFHMHQYRSVNAYGDCQTDDMV